MPPFKTAILFVIFNRPDKTAQVFEAIRAMRPEQLFIAADGPRSDKKDDVRLCAEARAIVSKIDWSCEVQTDFLEANIGSHKRMASAITWFFQNVQEGIILEDDCLPGEDFFKFCEELLEKYRAQPHIMLISGDNFQDGHMRGLERGIIAPQQSYYFSQYANIWGWATWRRAWNAYQDDLRDFPAFEKSGRIAGILPPRREQHFWIKFFKKIHAGIYPFWDAKWMFSIWNARGICISPNVNLVTNIGHGKGATNTTDEHSRHIIPLAKMKWPLQHPFVSGGMKTSNEADRYLFSVLYYVPLHKRIWNRIFATISR